MHRTSARLSYPVGYLIEEIEARVERAGTDPIWGYEHCLRVYALARDLGFEEDLFFDAELLYIAALLHDIGLYKAYARRKEVDHARRSCAVAEQLLRDADFPTRDTETVLDAIEHHPPGAPSGSSAEAALLKDAVALDYLGTIGVSRALAMVSVEEEIPNLHSAISNIQNLHRSIPGHLILDSSKDLARERIAETKHFVDKLGHSTANLKLL